MTPSIVENIHTTHTHTVTDIAACSQAKEYIQKHQCIKENFGTYMCKPKNKLPTDHHGQKKNHSMRAEAARGQSALLWPQSLGRQLAKRKLWTPAQRASSWMDSR